MTVTVLTVSGIAVGAGGGAFGFDTQQASGSAGDHDPGTKGISAAVDGSGSGAAVSFEQSSHDDGWEGDGDEWEDDDDDDRWEDDDDRGAEDD
jgi:hypothetical protein